MKDDVAAVQGDVAAVQGDVTAVLGSNITKVLEDVVRNTADITSLGLRGHWCGEQDGPWNTVGTITYDSITYSDSNMDITATPLDINTGINSLYFYWLHQELRVSVCVSVCLSIRHQVL